MYGIEESFRAKNHLISLQKEKLLQLTYGQQPRRHLLA